MNFQNMDKHGIIKSLSLAFLILFAHIILLAGIGTSIVVFIGVYKYLPWIMAFIALSIVAIGFAFYYRISKSSSEIKDILSMPEFQGRTIEVKLAGGLASFKIGSQENQHMLIEHQPFAASNQLLIGNDINKTEQKIFKLTALLEKDIITKEEFDTARQNIIQG